MKKRSENKRNLVLELWVKIKQEKDEMVVVKKQKVLKQLFDGRHSANMKMRLL